MLKLVILSAALAAVTSSPIYSSYMMSPYLGNPYGIAPYGYTGPVPVPYLRTGIPTPFVSANPYAAPAAEPEPLLPFTSLPSGPVYLTPEQHYMYEAALKSHDPLGYADSMQTAEKKRKKAHQ